MTLRVLTIGAGFFAELHVEAWARNPDADPVGLVDRDRAKADTLACKHAPKAARFDTLEAALDQLTPDIIDIATPPETHLDLIKTALKAQPKAIICQKPFCGSMQHAAAAVQSAKEAATPLIIHENFRFQPWYRRLHTELAKGTIGDLLQITFRLRPGDGQGPDAYLSRQPYFQKMDRFLIHETAIHWIDTFRYLLGEPDAVMADLRRLNPAIRGEDAGLFIFKYPDGKRAIFDGNRLADHAADNPRLTMGECLLEGTTGSLTLNGFGQIHHRPRGDTKTTQLHTTYNTKNFGGDCVYSFQKHVTDHLTQNTPLENTAQDYLQNMRIENAIYTSAEHGHTVKL